MKVIQSLKGAMIAKASRVFHNHVTTAWARMSGIMPRSRGISLAGLALVLGAGLGASLLRAQAPGPGAPPSPADDALIDEQIGQQCTKCHVRPQPEYVSQGQWRFRIQEMAERSMTGTGIPPGEESLLWQLDLEKIIRWFESRAPDVLPMPDAWPQNEGGLVFAKHPYNPIGDAPKPVVSNVQFYDLDEDGQTEIVACDMGRGSIFLGEPARAPGVLTQIAILSNPAHAEMVDLDQDGRQDLLIADLGEFLPSDHTKGSVAWLRQTAPLEFEKHVLIDHLPRSADARAADFDGDGDLDLIVAAYGWRKVGSTIYYENATTDWSEPRFVPYTIDARPGPIHVPPLDLNGDGRLDFVVLVSQQYEHLVAYLARSRGAGFRQETIFRGPTPVWGSSGIEAVDFDRDGDQDVLMTNGDSLDDFTIRPFHGIRLFENRGEFPFVQHDLAVMPGAHRAQIADMDGDGDNDIVACAFLPGSDHPQFQNLERQGSVDELTAVGWIEQIAAGEFRLHELKKGMPSHVTLDLGDYDHDGDVDIVLGNLVGFTFGKADTGFSTDTWVEVWENRTPREGEAATASR